MAKVIVNGRSYYIFEMPPTFEERPVISPKDRDDKKRNQQNRRNMARYNYRKK